MLDVHKLLGNDLWILQVAGLPGIIIASEVHEVAIVQYVTSLVERNLQATIVNQMKNFCF